MTHERDLQAVKLDIDVKLCECGCGQPAAIAGSTDGTRGYVKGQPTRFARGHRHGSRGARRPTRDGHKVCVECGEEKPLDAFPQDPGRADRRYTYCRPCKARLMREANRRYKQRYPARTRRREREAYLRKRYGMTVEDYDWLLMIQGGRCAICGTTEPPLLKETSSSGLSFAIDHDHETGAVRGLLCGPCNLGLGNLADDPARLRAAATYLERAVATAHVVQRLPGPGQERLDAPPSPLTSVEPTDSVTGSSPASGAADSPAAHAA